MVYALRRPGARALSAPLLAQAAREYWGLSPLPAIARGSYGKPYFPEHRACEFNLSHSGDLLVCALDLAPVGADIQTVKRPSPRLLDRACSEEERLWLGQRGDDPAAFALLWALKESRCKQSGRGLSLPIPDISVPLPGDGERVLEQDGLVFYLASGPGWQLALCGTTAWDGSIRWVKDGIGSE